jgi:hypothetical protein
VPGSTKKSANHTSTCSEKLRLDLKLWLNNVIWPFIINTQTIFMRRNVLSKRNARLKTNKIKLGSKRKRTSESLKSQKKKKKSKPRKLHWTKAEL